MRNLIVTCDKCLDCQTEGSISAIIHNSSLSEIIFLTCNGTVSLFSFCGELMPTGTSFRIGHEIPDDDEWFEANSMLETGSIVCISHSGNIVSISSNMQEFTHEGCVEGGVAAAKWSPDQTILVLVTNNDSIISMTSSFEVLQEVPMEGRLADSVVDLSWRGDGEHFVISTTDTDNKVRVRIFSKELELLHLGRNVTDDSPLIGLGSCCCYAGNGNLVAVTQERIPGKPQIAFLEPNGFRHGDFDLHVPTTVPGVSWKVGAVHWDISSTVLAVHLIPVGNQVCDENLPAGVVQLYTRGNYHWYLKQQISRVERILQFDGEIVNRLYVISRSPSGRPLLRVLEYTWDVAASCSSDGSVAVVDGSSILLTPLGLATIPPPMSKYKLNLPAPCRNASFWARENGWGLCCLCDQGTVVLFHGDSKGSPDGGVILQFQESFDVSRWEFRSAIATVFGGVLTVHLLGYCFDDMKDVIVSVPLNETDVATSFASPRVHDIILGEANRILHWPSDPASLGVGVGLAGGFEVQRHSMSSAGDLVFEESFPLPEKCAHLQVVAGIPEGEDLENSVAVVGLSDRNRLYCGEVLLFAGASSVVVNDQLGMLLFSSVGTRPLIHFLSLRALLKLAHLFGMHGSEAEYVRLECAEPRPIERGGRIVASIPGDPKVVIQLPRGNLEAFEPRPLILMKAQQHLNNNRLFQCLVLLRRQKVDLNYMVDFNAEQFQKSVESFVKAVVSADQCDLLSLFISSLAPNDFSLQKYPTVETSVSRPEPLIGDRKVNVVCESVRRVLLDLLPTHPNVLPALLCTFAKQLPPLLEEGLELISRLFVGPGSVRSNALTSSKVQSSLKYLAFLAEGTVLFESALGVCDFEMARAIARQCQMDPKVYMPLLERLENIGKGYPEDSLEHALMRFRVNCHLSRHARIIDWGVVVLERQTDTFPTTERNSVVETIISVVTANKLYTYVLSNINRKDFSASKSLREVFRRVQVSYGDFNMTSQQYKEAVSAYLSVSPPESTAAVQAARSDGDWQRALAIAGRFGEDGSGQNGLAFMKKVAHEIVAGFRESLELGDSDANGLSIPASDVEAAGAAGDRATEACQICLDYCDDTESAVSILLLSRKWLQAVLVSLKKGRRDLLIEEICPAVRSGCKDLIKTINRSEQDLLEINAYLKDLWKDPEERIQRVAAAEPFMQAELQGRGNYMSGEGALDDTKSEFSAMSYVSGASYISSASAATSKSGTSTVSVLSSLSLTPSVTEAQGGEKAFSIGGLEHTLLSRGKASTRNEKQESLRKQQRREKTRVRGQGPDVCGLRRETAEVDRLWPLANFSWLAKEAEALLEALLLLGDSNRADVLLAMALQEEVDRFASVLQQNPPPVAPNYPPEWLRRRQMSAVLRLQDRPEPVGDTETPNIPASAKSWWQTAADGILLWQGIRRVSLV